MEEEKRRRGRQTYPEEENGSNEGCGKAERGLERKRKRGRESGEVRKTRVCCQIKSLRVHGKRVRMIGWVINKGE